MDYTLPPVGALCNNGRCVFTVWAPQATRVDLITAKQESALQKDAQGYWTIALNGVEHGTPYQFRLNADKILPDPASRWQAEGVHGPSFVCDQNFDWTDKTWKGILLGQMVLYELHVGTFSETGNFEGVISSLDYLKELGVNAIELLPISQFPGNRNWGYDGVYPFAAHHDYGGPTGLKRLVNEAHRKDIAVVLDVVYNHQGPEGNYLSEYGPYFTDRYKTGWGKAINFDDAWCDGVRNFYWQNALMWLEEFHIDGLRLDAVHAIWDFSAKHFIEELTHKVSEIEKKSGRKKVLIAEFDLNNPRYINPYDKGGYGLDGQWIDEFHHALHALVTGEVDGYYEDFGDMQHLVRAYRDSYVYTGQFSKHRKKFFGVLPQEIAYDQFVVFAQNHDQIGNRMLGDRLAANLSFEALKLVAAAVLLAPQVPLLFMGEEYGEQNPFQYFISHTDNELVEMVREGRKKEFSYFNWQGEVPDPQSEKTFEQCKLSWNYTNGQHAILFSYYKYLIGFRKNRKAMQGRRKENVRVREIAEKKIIGMERSFEGDILYIFLNFEKTKVVFKTPFSQSLKMIFNSADTHWVGRELHPQTNVSPDENIVMSPESVLIFEL
ncbi:malto-oligosyltrehalose trehalohydrolase [Chryseolinea sp. H1M3-3]|uniref:malto-oligosyltrehalose trehalohydrolase n=1 Tax=Chryseolinea sp. H1M3-3 TaxID=3034144 RepID=UPI0023ECB238|nr:malto-oligosyltrehalose trehalohydrolase [Chryseolinea sp. H1M3-3]